MRPTTLQALKDHTSAYRIPMQDAIDAAVRQYLNNNGADSATAYEAGYQAAVRDMSHHLDKLTKPHTNDE